MKTPANQGESTVQSSVQIHDEESALYNMKIDTVLRKILFSLPVLSEFLYENFV